VRVLVAEDNLLEAEFVEQALKHAGCEVIGPVPRLAQALDLALHSELDAALLDINLAGVNSFAAAWRLQERKIPFAFLSAYPRSIIPGPGPLWRAPFVAKPVDAKQLVEAVTGLIRNVPLPPVRQRPERRLKRRTYNF
jgi:DNA-binding response OmpR family regulator